MGTFSAMPCPLCGAVVPSDIDHVCPGPARGASTKDAAKGAHRVAPCDCASLRARLAAADARAGEAERERDEAWRQFHECVDKHDALDAALAASRAEAERLRGLIESVIRSAPTDADFADGGRYDYDADCGNTGDVQTLGWARAEYETAKFLRASLTPAPEGR